MEKKKIYLIVAVLFLGFCGYLISETLELAKYKRNLEIGSVIPRATFVSLTGDSISLNINPDENVCIMFFSVSCPHCISEFKEIESNKDSLSDYTFILIGKEPYDEIHTFINDYPNVKSMAQLYSDTNNEFLKTFGSSIVPNAFFYKERKLIKNIRGAFDIKKINDVFKGIHKSES